MARLYEELKRRNVIRVTIAYAVVAWLVAQLAEFSITTFGAPEWVLRTFVVFLILGLPIAVILAWAFDLTPTGVRKTSDHDVAEIKKRGTNFGGAILLGIVLIAAVVLQFWGPEIAVQSATPSVNRTNGNPSRHYDISFPEDTPLAFIGAAPLGNGRQAFAISPDGTRMVFLGVHDEEFALYVRELDSHEVRKLQGTENGFDPFFSPNGQWLAFFAGNELKRVRLDGGATVTIGEATNSAGGTWLDNDNILAMTDEGDSVVQFSTQGDRQESPNWLQNSGPQAIANTGKILASELGTEIRIGDLTTQKFSSLQVTGAYARYFSGLIFYSQGNSLFAARFDPTTLTLKSTPVPVLTDLRVEVYGFSQWSVSANGTFLYAPGIAAQENPLQWVRGSKHENLNLPQRQKGSFEISPDGKHLAVLESQAGMTDLWLHDFEGRAPRKLTVDGNLAANVVAWMPDGKSIIYHELDGARAIPHQLFLDSGMRGKPLFEINEENIRVSSVSQDGRYLGINKGFAFAPDSEESEPGSDRIAVIDTLEDQEIEIPTLSRGSWGTAISPDGRAVVYTSPESGEYQNYLQPFPPTGERYQVSRVGGAEEPRWSSDGSKIYYRSGQRIMVVPVQTTPEIRIEDPQVFYEGEFVNVGGRSYDISPDGERALVITASEGTAKSIRVITNWFDEVERIISASE